MGFSSLRIKEILGIEEDLVSLKLIRSRNLKTCLDRSLILWVENSLCYFENVLKFSSLDFKCPSLVSLQFCYQTVPWQGGEWSDHKLLLLEFELHLPIPLSVPLTFGSRTVNSLDDQSSAMGVHNRKKNKQFYSCIKAFKICSKIFLLPFRKILNKTNKI